MPARLRLPAVLLLCAVATGLLSFALWRIEQDDVRNEARERAQGTAAALEERTEAAILALQGVRAGYDASPDAFASFARYAWMLSTQSKMPFPILSSSSPRSG